MPLAIPATSAATHIPARTTPPPAAAPRANPSVGAAAAQPAATSNAGARRQQQAALNQLVTRYAQEQSRGIDPNTLSNLGRQITTAARVLGQHVTLPHGPAGAAAAPPPPTPVAGKVNVTV